MSGGVKDPAVLLTPVRPGRDGCEVQPVTLTVVEQLGETG
jgi:hypothetical protein